ncbi:MAG: beta-galactosidase [Paenibacillus sp.]|nr:beta-galactosidase [Paenibacillus sp.]
MEFGACYYPEHWPEERWPEDARMMREAGFTMVRLAEFAWSKFERREGEYDFGWLDRSLAILSSNGIRVTLGTPTATPPKWLMDKHPDIYMKDYYGRVRGYGNRRHYCYNNATYHGYVAGIVERMARHYADNASVAAWQIDNEFGCNDTTRCYCDNCRTGFQQWLSDKYGDIDSLNESWGTVFWSHIYNDFSEIELPGYTVFQLHNPGHALDFRRFASDSVKRFQKLQTDILRRIAPHQKLTHNFMGAFNEVDQYDLAEDLDFASWDNYPNLHFAKEADPAFAALQHDLTRSLKNKGFWVMEHQSGQPGGNIMFATPKPGELRRWTYQSVARGADGILYFRWRGCLFGAEQYWHGILNHDGKPGRKYAETKQVGAELARLGPVLAKTTSKARVAMIRSYDIEWVFEIQPHLIDYNYMNHFATYYRTLYERHLAVDIVSPDADLSSYSLVVLPNFIMAEQSVADKIGRFVRDGGTVVMDFRAGAKEWNNRMEALTLPGKFTELLGISVSDYGIIGKGEKVRVKVAGDEEARHSASTWYDAVKAETAETVAAYDEDYYAGSAAVTRNAYGSGAAYYIGTEADRGLLSRVMDRACEDAGLEGNLPIRTGEKTEVVIREGETSLYYIVINHMDVETSVLIEETMQELMTDRSLSGDIALEGNGVMILSRPKEATS